MHKRDNKVKVNDIIGAPLLCVIVWHADSIDRCCCSRSLAPRLATGARQGPELILLGTMRMSPSQETDIELADSDLELL